MTQRASEVDAWIGRLPKHQRQQVSQLADLIQDATDGLAEAVKWGRLTFTVNDNWHHWLCAISATEASVKLTFHKGALLDDPAGLLEGGGRYVRHIQHDVAIGDPEPVIRLVQEAITHQTDMLDD